MCDVVTVRGTPNAEVGSAAPTAKSLPCEAVRARQRNAADRVKMIKIPPLEEKTVVAAKRARAHTAGESSVSSTLRYSNANIPFQINEENTTGFVSFKFVNYCKKSYFILKYY